MDDGQKYKLYVFGIAVIAFISLAFVLAVKEFKTAEMGMKNGYEQDKGGNWVRANTLVVHE